MGLNWVWCEICAKYLAFDTYPTSIVGALKELNLNFLATCYIKLLLLATHSSKLLSLFIIFYSLSQITDLTSLLPLKFLSLVFVALSLFFTNCTKTPSKPDPHFSHPPFLHRHLKPPRRRDLAGNHGRFLLLLPCYHPRHQEDTIPALSKSQPPLDSSLTHGLTHAAKPLIPLSLFVFFFAFVF